MQNPHNIFDFWQCYQTEKDQSIHPADLPFLNAARGITFALDVGRPPTPWDGPLASARVIFCYSNPRFSTDDLQPCYSEIMQQQLSGKHPLPITIEHWARWYRGKFRFLGALEDIQTTLAVFNSCPYASNNMDGANGRVAAGLPSTWAAQEHLRNVLIPRAKVGEIFLVVVRGHQRWGVTPGFSEPNISLVSAGIGGNIPTEIQSRILRWLDRAG